jgi:hypothetical protein
MPQTVYYIVAGIALGAPDRKVSFAVPTGNFGDIYAGYAAAMIGLPIERLVVASNVNDILTRALNSGDHTLGDVTATMSPSMDIQISSNFERLLFDVYDRDGATVRTKMQALKDDRGFTIDADRLAESANALMPIVSTNLRRWRSCDRRSSRPSRSSTRTRRWGWGRPGGPLKPTRSRRWSCCPRPTRPSSPMRWQRRSADAPRCPNT